MDEAAAAMASMRAVGRFHRGPPAVTALHEVDLDIGYGEHVAVVGPSGSGKSSLLQLFGLLDQPTLGTYRFDGIETTELTGRGAARLRRERIGFVFQSFHLLPERDVLTNVGLGLMAAGIRRRDREERSRTVLARLGLDHLAEASAAVLSGGEQQRVAIARALVTEPDLIICDEPTGNLDRTTGAHVLDLLAALHADGATLIIATHDPQVADRATRQISVMDGRVLAEPPP